MDDKEALQRLAVRIEEVLTRIEASRIDIRRIERKVDKMASEMERLNNIAENVEREKLEALGELEDEEIHKYFLSSKPS